MNDGHYESLYPQNIQLDFDHSRNIIEKFLRVGTLSTKPRINQTLIHCFVVGGVGSDKPFGE